MVVMAWADLLGVELEAAPPLVALVVAVAVAREAAELQGSEDARFREAAARLQAGDGDGLLRKVRLWRARSGKTFSDREEAAAQVS